MKDTKDTKANAERRTLNSEPQNSDRRTANSELRERRWAAAKTAKGEMRRPEGELWVTLPDALPNTLPDNTGAQHLHVLHGRMPKATAEVLSKSLRRRIQALLSG